MREQQSRSQSHSQWGEKRTKEIPLDNSSLPGEKSTALLSSKLLTCQLSLAAEKQKIDASDPALRPYSPFPGRNQFDTWHTWQSPLQIYMISTQHFSSGLSKNYRFGALLTWSECQIHSGCQTRNVMGASIHYGGKCLGILLLKCSFVVFLGGTSLVSVFCIQHPIVTLYVISSCAEVGLNAFSSVANWFRE